MKGTQLYSDLSQLALVDVPSAARVSGAQVLELQNAMNAGHLPSRLYTLSRLKMAHSTVDDKRITLGDGVSITTDHASGVPVDKNGHVLWGASFDDKTRAALLKQMRFHVKHMVDNAEYPTLSSMVPSLTNMTQRLR